MPTSATGSRLGRAGRRGAGFTLIELVLVLAIIAVATGVAMIALRDPTEARLEEEAARLSALLEMARTESRVAGTAVVWVPRRDDATGLDPNVQFRFVGLSDRQALPTRWLDPQTRATIDGGAPAVVLGPEAILPPQRIVLRLGERQLEIATDGLAPFAVPAPPPASP